eukprot:TRINITY_DN48416_c0_g1_i1.p2 TRINITY_DN48416_c0_g1~~TRINITY_DN48416_c0_g1_i1.p2  ORF type:complete len:100 (+),score=23.66 TRINITY_DN48416_c0_g1_i1:59-358(+)
MGKTATQSRGPHSVSQCLRWCEGKVRTDDECTNACMDHFGADGHVAKAERAKPAAGGGWWSALTGSKPAPTPKPKSFFSDSENTMPHVGNPSIGAVPGI